MVDLSSPSGPALVRTISTGAGDDDDWPTLGTNPADAITFYHPGGTLHLFFVLVDGANVVVARGAAAFTFELMRVANADIEFTNNGTSVETNPQIDYLEEYAVAGNYVVRVTGKSGMSAAVSLLIYAQAGT